MVRRLTVGAGAAALGLAGWFTASAATATPIAIAGPPDARPPAVDQPVPGDRVFVRRVHTALQPPAGGVRSPVPAAGASAAAAQSVPAPGPAPVAAPPVTPKPAAATGGTKPR